MERSAYIYLDSRECREEFPKNSPDSFENRISTLNLDPLLEYECCMLRLLHPRNYTTLSPNDGDFLYTLKTHKRRGRTESHEMFRFTPKPVNNDNLVVICEQFEAMVLESLKGLLDVRKLHTQVISYGPTPRLFEYIPKTNTVYVTGVHHLVHEDEEGIAKVLSVQIKFNELLANVFGVPVNEYITIYSHRDEDPIGGSYTPNYDPKVRMLYVYTDIVAPVRYGEKQVGILNVAEAHVSGESKSFVSPLVYIPVNKKNVETIAILLTDNHGARVPFYGGEKTTVLLHIRPQSNEGTSGWV